MPPRNDGAGSGRTQTRTGVPADQGSGHSASSTPIPHWMVTMQDVAPVGRTMHRWPLQVDLVLGCHLPLVGVDEQEPLRWVAHRLQLLPRPCVVGLRGAVDAEGPLIEGQGAVLVPVAAGGIPERLPNGA